MKNIISILLLVVFATVAAAQEDHSLIDSLRREYYAAVSSKQKAELCNKIASEAYSPDTVIKYSQIAIETVGGLDFKGMAKCYSYMGWAFFIKRDFVQSLDKYKQSAVLYERLGNSQDASMIYINIAACYRYTQNYKEMWEYLYRGLNKAEQAKDTANVCYAYSEIADVYQSQKMGTMAQEMLLKALKMARGTGNYAEMAVYAKQLGGLLSTDELEIEGIKTAKNWALKAEEYFRKAEPLDHYYEAMRNNNYAELIYCNLELAKFYYDDSYIDSSRSYVELFDNYANNITNVTDDKITSLHIHARQLLYEQKYRRAIDMLQKCISISKKDNNNYLSDITYKLLAEAYENVGDYKNALLALDKYNEMVQSHSNVDAMTQTIAYNARDQIEREKRSIELENELAREHQEEIEHTQQRTFAAIVAISFAAVSILVIMFFSWLATRRAVNKIAACNVQVLKQQVIIDDQTKELQETTSKIQQSMTYASRIQMAATCSPEELLAVFPESLVIYRPQEIVSGDWYLVKRTEHERYVAVGGSTEHGVPGAMASMLVVDSLKEAVSKTASDTKVSPAEILAQVESKVRSSIGAGVEIAISFCIIDDNGQMRFSAINNTAVIIHGGEASTLSVSKHEDEVTRVLDEDDYIVLYSQNTRRIMEQSNDSPETLCKILATGHFDTQQSAIDTIAGNNQSGDITIVGLKAKNIFSSKKSPIS